MKRKELQKQDKYKIKNQKDIIEREDDIEEEKRG